MIIFDTIFYPFLYINFNDITPLHYLCLNGNSESILKILLSNNEVDVNAMTNIFKIFFKWSFYFCFFSMFINCRFPLCFSL